MKGSLFSQIILCVIVIMAGLYALATDSEIAVIGALITAAVSMGIAGIIETLIEIKP